MPAAKATEAAIRRAINAWLATTRQPVGSVEVGPDGTVRVVALVDKSTEQAQPTGPKKWRG
jgi:hypothetical protein